jgi:uncharacterized protein (DUF4415 family)
MAAKKIRSDLKRVDRHVIQPHEYDEAPELTDKQLARAVVSVGGRPKIDDPKVSTTIRLDADVLEHFRKLGPGWQTRINAALRAAMKKRRAA